MRASAADVQDFILGRLEDPLQAKGLTQSELPASFDLLLEGLIDSFGVIEMIGAVEERFGLEFDFDELASDDLTRIGPLSSYVAAKLDGR